MLAISPADFWHRWHISLSQWFRDYVYIPLGGSRGTAAQWVAAILITFLLSGLWHGANWTFVAWGAVHGIAVIISVLVAHLIGERVGANFFAMIIAWLATQVFVTLSWVYFRADSMATANHVLAQIGRDFVLLGAGWRELASLPALLELTPLTLSAATIAIAWMLIFDRAVGLCGEDAPMARWSTPARLGSQAAMIFAITFAWHYRPVVAKPFIYFQF
jgi:D-alanyl-lipoteichoic acid acyltransferase DltB (MBOAT superfamily)